MQAAAKGDPEDNEPEDCILTLATSQ